MTSARELEKALIFSLAGHLFLLNIFLVVVSPGGWKETHIPPTYFLGSILNPVSFPGGEKKLSFSPPPTQVSRRFLRQEVELSAPAAAGEKKTGRPDKPLLAPHASKPDRRPPENREWMNVTGGKTMSEDIIPGLSRKLLFRPPLDYAFRRKDESDDFLVGVRFRITAEGMVKMVEIVRTSGYPDIDLLAKRYVRSWRFSPLAAPSPGESAEPVKVLLDLRLREKAVEFRS